MLMIKVAIYILISASFGQLVVECRNVWKKTLRDADYEASGDYFEAAQEETTTRKNNKSLEDDEGDDGVTCSETNVTKILSSFEIENLVLVLFKVNVTANEKELIYFLSLAKRLSQASSVFADHKFIVLSMDQNTEVLNEIIDKEEVGADVIAIDEIEFPDLGFVIDFDELHVYIVDQCGKLTYIIVPPYSSAEQPYVKAGLLSTLFDLPCGCPASELFSNRLDEFLAESMIYLSTAKNEPIETTTIPSVTELETSTTILLLNDDEDIENINDLIDNTNNLNEMSFNQTDNTTLPLRIIIPSDHVHFDNKSQNYYKYEHIILRSDDSNYHEHFSNVETLMDIDNERLRNFTGKIFVGNNSLSDIKMLSNEKILVNRLGFFYRISKERGEKTFEITPLEFDVIKVPAQTQIYGVKQHYQQLNKWLNYVV